MASKDLGWRHKHKVKSRRIHRPTQNSIRCPLRSPEKASDRPIPLPSVIPEGICSMVGWRVWSMPLSSSVRATTTSGPPSTLHPPPSHKEPFSLTLVIGGYTLRYISGATPGTRII
ncbi:hypothetical protein BP00DRAFT_172520 [Aspergillus indologenus CBS 114.80]|uniref:Uncharacterized protein n=1 Tax=Aspergillus indologenus CBS 114.80 TaxID=1450541 RepID=A0A2V5IPE1_9EURO|nr:hypothetical protein BP00DRAFT_172520 [Aspergillus indologenus CBS 114.80]